MREFWQRHSKILYRSTAFIIIAAILMSVTVFGAETDGAATDATATATDGSRVTLTAEEFTYQQAHPTITIAADASWRPLEYLDEDTKQYAGVIPEILRKLEGYTGFEIEYKVMDSYADALKAVQSGEADMISGLAFDEEVAKQYNVSLSTPYLSINSAVISKNEWHDLYQSDARKRIAVIEGDYANAYIEAQIPNVELVECTSNEECLDKVQDGEVDMAILAAYCTEYYMGIPKYSALKSHTISDFSWLLCFGISNQNDKHLTSILNKGIDKLSDWDINQAVYEGVINGAYDNEWLIFVYKHPIFVIGGILLIVFVIGLLLLTIFVIKRRGSKRRIEDGERLRLALERTHLCIWELDLKTRSITKMDNAHELHGFYELRNNIPESVIEAGYVHPEDVPIIRETMEQVYAGKQDVKGCWRIRKLPDNGPETTYWWEQVLFHLIYDERHRPVRVIGVSEDITKGKIAQRDSLTSVYNRRSFERKASIILNERRNAYLQCAFLILDLDGFKQINDTYGHAVGDQVLMAVGAAMTKTFRSTDIVGRLGGDEFTVFMTSITKREDAYMKAKELVENISQIQEKEDFAFPVSCSLGVVIATKGKDDLATLYKKADTALYEAKHAGKNQFKIYE
ncbi:MAG: diguanylate cyclase [Lachnospiraceae bacterium]|nr:diguanylate cyclase [Lachnospiraceae bacterium]